ncbi:MAG: hypothetical protein HY236_16770 [Acidobacteria bacterium]|nr:hypothetical protein [Acidobacteriota bacterium]
MPVKAIQHFARMRGGAQAQLLLASDGHYYIVKFQNNPQHRRVLANELLAYVLLRQLELPTPPGEIVEVGEELITGSPGLYIEAGGRRAPCGAGLQFGSRYPGDPARLPVYDYIPDALLRQVVNADSFLGMVAFDKWVSNADGRQAIFFRDHVSRWLPAAAAVDRAQQGFVAVMIDHGFAFTAQRWSFQDLPQLGIYPRPWLYQRVSSYDSFEPWLGRICHFSADVLDDAYKRIPPQWYDGDLAALEQLLEQLYARRARLPDLLRAAKKGPRDPFPNWS